MNLQGRVIAVTGGAGLIGSFLVDRLLEVDAKVIVADDFSKGRLDNLAHCFNRISLRQGNLEEPSAMDAALSGVEIVFHLASRAYGVGFSEGNHLKIIEHNEKITNNLISTLRSQPVAHLLVASSSCVYRDDGPDTINELPLFDGEPERANWGYGWAKRFLEQKCQLLASETGLPITIARPFNIYGERYAWQGNNSQVIPMQIKKVLDGDDPVVIWGSGKQRRNYMHAIDCADAMAGLVESNFLGAVNIGTEDTISLRELVEMICDISHRSPKLVFDATKPEGRAIKSSNSMLLRSAYPNFNRTIALRSGLERMVEWYKKEFALL